MNDITELINKYGFPIVAAFGTGGMVYYVWTWVTNEIKPVMGDANKTLIELIDRIRMLDNDLIRLNQKLNVILSLRESGELSTQHKGDLKNVKESLKNIPDGTANSEFKQ
jgi:ArsR family metal-binding transcriptional regulator